MALSSLKEWCKSIFLSDFSLKNKWNWVKKNVRSFGTFAILLSVTAHTDRATTVSNTLQNCWKVIGFQNRTFFILFWSVHICKMYHINFTSLPMKTCRCWLFHAFLSIVSHFLLRTHWYALCGEVKDSKSLSLLLQSRLLLSYFWCWKSQVIVYK